MSKKTTHSRESLLAFLQGVTTRTHWQDQSDCQLLQCFLAAPGEDAFTELVRRHGPLVYGVCQRILNHVADAEDAFQATFLVLAKRARTIRKRQSLASWLYGVALRCALYTKSRQALRREREDQVKVAGETMGMANTPLTDQHGFLMEEVQRLPEKYRLPILHCYFAGCTQQEAAEKLDWPLGTVAGRLSRAKQMLKKRLEKHGIVGGLAVVVTLLEQQRAPAAVASSLLYNTVQIIMANTIATPTAPECSPEVSSIAEHVSRKMLFSGSRVALLSALVLVGFLGVVIAGANVSLQDTSPPTDTITSEAVAIQEKKPAVEEKENAGPVPGFELANDHLWRWKIDDEALQLLQKRQLSNEIPFLPEARGHLLAAAPAIAHFNNIIGQKGVEITGVRSSHSLVLTPKGIRPFSHLKKYDFYIWALGDSMAGAVCGNISPDDPWIRSHAEHRPARAKATGFGQRKIEEGHESGELTALTNPTRGREKFVLVTMPQNKILCPNGPYFGVLGRTGFLTAWNPNREGAYARHYEINDWEMWHLIKNSDGTVSFRNRMNGHYLSVEKDGTCHLRSRTLNDTAKFQMLFDRSGCFRLKSGWGTYVTAQP